MLDDAKVFLVNLVRRPDRLADFRRNQAEHGWRLPEPELFAAIDGRKVPSPHNWRAGGGAWGCMQSHRHILERCLIEGVSQVAVFEDDAAWTADAWPALEAFLAAVPKDWDALMLGGQHLGRGPLKAAAGVSRTTNCQRTHAYVLRGKTIAEVYRKWVGGNGHCDHIMGPFLGTKKTFAPDPFIFGQAPGKSDINGSQHALRYWSRAKTPPDVVCLLECSRETLEAVRKLGFHSGHWRNENGEDRGLMGLMANKGPGFPSKLAAWHGVLRKELASPDGVVVAWGCGVQETDLAAAGLRVIRVSGSDPKEIVETVKRNVFETGERHHVG